MSEENGQEQMEEGNEKSHLGGSKVKCVRELRKRVTRAPEKKKQAESVRLKKRKA